MTPWNDLLFFLFFFLDCDKVMDVGVVVDSSSSVTRKNFDIVKNFLKKLVDMMHVSDNMTHFGVIHYNHRAYLDWDFNSTQAKNSDALKESIDGLEYRPGGTRTDIAMDSAILYLFKAAHGQRPNVPLVLLVITDGRTSGRSKKYSIVLKPFKVMKLNKTRIKAQLYPYLAATLEEKASSCFIKVGCSIGVR